MTFIGVVIVIVIVIFMIIGGVISKKKWLRIASLGGFALIVVFVYSIVKGVPFGNYIAQAKISNYARQVYGITTKLKMPQYNVVNSNYVANILQQENVEFEITYDLSSNKIYDERVNTAYNGLFQEEYQEILKLYDGNVELPLTNISTSILANGKYSKDIYDLTCFQIFYITGIVNREKISPEESSKMPAKITRDVLDKLSNKFNVTSLQIIYTDLNGTFETIVKGKDKLTVEKMQKNTAKLDKLGEVEKKLILELNK
ncbi:MAG: hypothetical protein ACREVX_14630 [Clostridium sp.]|uniref:hypothetical protein n=1 Tax=Clostridium sp. TaxID=1506 RepID=UPI003D6CDC35